MSSEPIDPSVLLDRGADLSRIDDRGRTALAAVVVMQSTDTVAGGSRAGADPDIGGPGARATAAFSGLPAMGEQLDAR